MLKHGRSRLLEFTWWLLLVILVKMSYHCPSGFIALQRRFTAGKPRLLLVDQTMIEAQSPGTYPRITIPFSWYWYPTLVNIHHIFHQSLNGWQHRQHECFLTLPMDPIPMRTSYWPDIWKINKTVPCCECYALEPRVAKDETWKNLYLLKYIVKVMLDTCLRV